MLSIFAVGVVTLMARWNILRGNSSSGSTIASRRHTVAVTRVVNEFEDAFDGPLRWLPSESAGEVVLDIQNGFVLDRGVVGEVDEGVVFDVSGGCCQDSAESFLVRVLETQLLKFALLGHFISSCDITIPQHIFLVPTSRSYIGYTAVHSMS